MKLIFLLEEASMKEVLDILLPKIVPAGVMFRTIPHSGKSDLQRSIPRKLKGWNEPDVKFVIVQDQDSSDCVELKERLKRLVDGTGRTALIRIACHELEAWYFGDLQAVSAAYGIDIAAFQNKSKYRIPDEIANPKEELRKLVPRHQQLSGARKIAPYMKIGRNRSRSFQVLVEGIQRLCLEATEQAE